MKITESEVIRNGEQELIDSIIAELDWGNVEGIFRQEHGLDINEDVEYEKGDMVVHDNQIAYRLDFKVKVTLSVLLDRHGNYISLETGGSEHYPFDPATDPEGYSGDLESLSNPEEKISGDGPSEGNSRGDFDLSPTPAPEMGPEERISMAASRAEEEMTALDG